MGSQPRLGRVRGVKAGKKQIEERCFYLTQKKEDEAVRPQGRVPCVLLVAFFLWGWATASRRESLPVSLGERHIYTTWELTVKRRLSEMHNASTTSNHFLFRSPKS